MKMSRIAQFLRTPVQVINIGLPGFAQELRQAGIAVLQLDWAPPATRDSRIPSLLAKLSAGRPEPRS